MGTWSRRTWHPKKLSHWSSSASSSACSPPSAGSSTCWCPCTCDKDPEPQGAESSLRLHLRGGVGHGQVKLPQHYVEMSENKEVLGLRGSICPSRRGEELPRSLQASAQPRAGGAWHREMLHPAGACSGQDQALLQDAESHCSGLSLGAASGTQMRREHLVGLGLEVEQLCGKPSLVINSVRRYKLKYAVLQ